MPSLGLHQPSDRLQSNQYFGAITFSNFVFNHTGQNANVDANKILMFLFFIDSDGDSTPSSDFSINATIKYHLR